jgi:hypothetical protein
LQRGRKTRRRRETRLTRWDRGVSDGARVRSGRADDARAGPRDERVGLLCARRAEAECGAGLRAGKWFAGLARRWAERDERGHTLGFGVHRGPSGRWWAERERGRWAEGGEEKRRDGPAVGKGGGPERKGRVREGWAGHWAEMVWGLGSFCSSIFFPLLTQTTQTKAIRIQTKI